MLDDTTTPPPPLPASHNPLVFWVVLLGLGVLLVITALLYTSSRGTSVVPANWHTFHDAKGLYTLRYPPDWTVSGGADHDGFTCSQGQCAAIDHEGYTFINPSQGSGTVYVHIDVFLFTAKAFRQSACRSISQGSTSQFHGFPAYYMNQGQWTFDTDAGNFQFTLSIPGAIELPVDIPNPPTTTPVPRSWTTTDQQEVATFLAAFTLIGAKHLSCS